MRIYERAHTCFAKEEISFSLFSFRFISVTEKKKHFTQAMWRCKCAKLFIIVLIVFNADIAVRFSIFHVIGIEDIVSYTTYSKRFIRIK